MQLLTQISVSQYMAPKSEPATIILADGGPLVSTHQNTLKAYTASSKKGPKMHPKKAEMEKSLLNCRPALLTSSGHTGTFILNQFGRCLQGDPTGCRTGNEGEVSNS